MTLADHSKIQWTDATWNPTTGCTKVSPGCAKCYIVRTPAFRIPGRRFVKGATGVRLHADRLDTPLHWRKPRRVFVNSLSDLFHEDVPDAFIDRVFAVMALAGQHTFQVLTKRPVRMRDYVTRLGRSVKPLEAIAREMGFTFAFENLSLLPWPIPNVWLGVSVENQHFADERIPLLLQTPAAVRFISAEPLLEGVDLHRIQNPADKFHASALQRQHDDNFYEFDASLDWVIVGGESGPGARPFDLAWARSILSQCRAAGVPVFVKQLGAKPFGLCTPTCSIGPHEMLFDDRKGADPNEWPDDVRVRDFPADVERQIGVEDDE